MNQTPIDLAKIEIQVSSVRASILSNTELPKMDYTEQQIVDVISRAKTPLELDMAINIKKIQHWNQSAMQANLP